jgi:endo-1,4-beta-xylanase
VATSKELTPRRKGAENAEMDAFRRLSILCASPLREFFALSGRQIMISGTLHSSAQGQLSIGAHMLRLLILACSVFCAHVLLGAEPEAILLWPNGAPGSEGKTTPEVIELTSSGERNVTQIHKPSLTPYLPAAGKGNGAAIVIAPGGGHSKLCVDHEGHNLARWLAERGTAAFVLKYRLAREKDSTYTLEKDAVGDMQRAIRLVRSRAKEWNIEANKVGALGFSAGGELAFMAAMQDGNGDAQAADEIDRQNARPDFQCLIYPGKSSRIEVTKDMPQAFIVCGYGDRQDIAHGMAEVYLKFKDAGVPAELHIYAAAGHGFGVRDSNRGAVSHWPNRLDEWLADKVVKSPRS